MENGLVHLMLSTCIFEIFFLVGNCSSIIWPSDDDCIEPQSAKLTNRQTEKQTNKSNRLKKLKQTYRQTDRQTAPDKQRDRQNTIEQVNAQT